MKKILFIIITATTFASCSSAPTEIVVNAIDTAKVADTALVAVDSVKSDSVK